MLRFVIAACLLLLVTSVQAREIGDVQIPESITVENGATLILNGAGIRSKFVFEVYIAQLYLQNPSDSAEQIITDDGQKRLVMHFLHSEVDKESLVEAWTEGFEANLNKEALAALQERIAAFNGMFITVKKGDVIVLDYTAAKGTEVTIAGEVKGVIGGKDFSDALFSIWLGAQPVSKDLKKELIAYKKQ